MGACPLLVPNTLSPPLSPPCSSPPLTSTRLTAPTSSPKRVTKMRCSFSSSKR